MSFEPNALLTHLRTNRFLPAPPPDRIFCGDGDYRAIGAEFLGHFIRFADLRPNERVLDLGCGIGRMAVPLTQYLSDEGQYDGLDIAASDIAWCQRVITPVYENFRFHILDIRHPVYNAGGSLDAANITLPFPDASFDLIALVSILTHVGPTVLLNYAHEIARLLAPGGRCFATAFLLNPPARAALRAGLGHIAFDPDTIDDVCYAEPEVPLAAVAYHEDFFVEKFLRFGRTRRDPALYGRWSGRESPVFQDICLFE